MAHSLGDLRTAGPFGSATALARISSADVAPGEGEPAFYIVEPGDSWFFQFFDTAGVLHNPGDSRYGIADRRLACSGENIGGAEPGAAGGKKVGGRAGDGRRGHGGGRVHFPYHFETASSGH